MTENPERNDSKPYRVVIKDIETRRILSDERLYLGQTFTIPEGYDIYSRETNPLHEEWIYVKRRIR